MQRRPFQSDDDGSAVAGWELGQLIAAAVGLNVRDHVHRITCETLRHTSNWNSTPHTQCHTLIIRVECLHIMIVPRTMIRQWFNNHRQHHCGRTRLPVAVVGACKYGSARLGDDDDERERETTMTTTRNDAERYGTFWVIKRRRRAAVLQTLIWIWSTSGRRDQPPQSIHI